MGGAWLHTPLGDYRPAESSTRTVNVPKADSEASLICRQAARKQDEMPLGGQCGKGPGMGTLPKRAGVRIEFRPNRPKPIPMRR